MTKHLKAPAGFPWLIGNICHAGSILYHFTKDLHGRNWHTLCKASKRPKMGVSVHSWSHKSQSITIVNKTRLSADGLCLNPFSSIIMHISFFFLHLHSHFRTMLISAHEYTNPRFIWYNTDLFISLIYDFFLISAAISFIYNLLLLLKRCRSGCGKSSFR